MTCITVILLVIDDLGIGAKHAFYPVSSFYIRPRTNG